MFELKNYVITRQVVKYNPRLRRVLAIIFAVEKQYVLRMPSVGL